jgi:hypothetical protein
MLVGGGVVNSFIDSIAKALPSLNAVQPAIAAAAARPSTMLRDPLLIAILLAAVALRLYMALTTSHIWDEDRDWILMAQRISFDPAAPYLPVRAFNHGALPAYFIKLGSFLFGETALGFRFAGVIAGTATVATVALIANAWMGRTAALWAAAFVGFNEFHVMVSAIASDKVYSIFFGALSAYAFVRALRDDRPVWLFPTAATAALSILCYEIMYLLVPIFGITVLCSKRRAWFGNAYLYLAAATGLAVLAPDLMWNLSAANASEMTYGGHLERFGGFGFNRHYLLFFFRDAILPIYNAFDRQLHDGFDQYAVMNVALGVLLLGAALHWAWRFARNRERREDVVLLFLLTVFWLIFLLFSLMKPGTSARLDNVGWPWVQFILIPAAVMAGAWIVTLKGRVRLAAAALGVIGVVYGAADTTVARLSLPQYAMALLPQTDTSAERITYRAVFHACVVCDPAPRAELLRIVGQDPTWSDNVPPAPSDVVGADFGAADFVYELRMPPYRAYRVEYRFTDRTGGVHHGEARIWSDLHAFAPPYWCADC